MVDIDLYLKSLEDRGKDISRREGSLAKQEKAVSVQRAQITAERAAWEAALAHYREFLQTQGRQVPVAVLDDTDQKPETTNFTNVNLRVGDKRRAVLLFIAKQSESGRKVTTREIIEGTGLDAALVGNVLWSDRNRGLLDRASDRIVMTRKGFEFIGKAGVYSVAGQPAALSVDEKN
jgi:hypothetical protein